MTTSKLPTAKKIGTGIYQVTFEGQTYTILCWASYFGEGSKEWQVYQCEASKVLEGTQGEYWVTGCRTKRAAIEWIVG